MTSDGMAVGRIHQINTSRGGAPKTPIERARVGELGIEGDEHNDRNHGGPQRALCLFSLEVIERLRAEGHPIAPGTAGENLTLAGLDWAQMQPGARLLLGDQVEIAVTSFTIPCKEITRSFSDGDFTRISEKLRPGESRIYARVLRSGVLAPGDLVAVIGTPDRN